MAAEATAGRKPLPEPPAPELVLKRNSMERLKLEKAPLGIIDELPQLIATGYADIPEEDIVRLKWCGLYHDKPKVGTFMLRIKLPAGRVTPEQLRADRRALERVTAATTASSRRARRSSCTTCSSRRCPRSSTASAEAGLTTAGALRRRRPQHHRLPGRRARARRAVRRDAVSTR